MLNEAINKTRVISRGDHAQHREDPLKEGGRKVCVDRWVLMHVGWAIQ